MGTLALAPSGMISKKGVPTFFPSTVLLLHVSPGASLEARREREVGRWEGGKVGRWEGAKVRRWEVIIIIVTIVTIIAIVIIIITGIYNIFMEKKKTYQTLSPEWGPDPQS